MKTAGNWIQIVLAGIGAGCGIFMWIRRGSTMSSDLTPVVLGMIVVGAFIILKNVAEVIKKRKGDDMHISKPQNLPVPCPLCNSKKGLQFVMEGEQLRLVCIDCKDVDEDLDPNKIFDTFITLVQYSHDNQGLEHETLADIIYEKFDLPELEEDDDEAE